jgi:hypothetical protein
MIIIKIITKIKKRKNILQKIMELLSIAFLPVLAAFICKFFAFISFKIINIKDGLKHFLLLLLFLWLCGVTSKQSES